MDVQSPGRRGRRKVIKEPWRRGGSKSAQKEGAATRLLTGESTLDGMQVLGRGNRDQTHSRGR